MFTLLREEEINIRIKFFISNFCECTRLIVVVVLDVISNEKFDVYVDKKTLNMDILYKNLPHHQILLY
jgi:hypothetical protein